MLSQKQQVAKIPEDMATHRGSVYCCLIMMLWFNAPPCQLFWNRCTIFFLVSTMSTVINMQRASRPAIRAFFFYV